MQNMILLNDIPPSGQSYTVDAPTVWSEPMSEFGMVAQVVEPLVAEVFLLPQEDGVFIKGTLKGLVQVPCDRCAEKANVTIAHSFEDFEGLPDVPDGLSKKQMAELVLTSSELDEAPLIRYQKGALIFDMPALLWEEFCLALPVKPLCKPDCAGVCPSCGKNLNDGACGCAANGGDPRLAALRQVKVKQGA